VQISLDRTRFAHEHYKLGASYLCQSCDPNQRALSDVIVCFGLTATGRPGVVLCRRAPDGVDIHALSQNRLKQDQGVKN